MRNEIALAEDAREFILVHEECPPSSVRAIRQVALLRNPISDLTREKCAWCKRELRFPADPHLIGPSDPEEHTELTT